MGVHPEGGFVAGKATKTDDDAAQTIGRNRNTPYPDVRRGYW